MTLDLTWALSTTITFIISLCREHVHVYTCIHVHAHMYIRGTAVHVLKRKAYSEMIFTLIISLWCNLGQLCTVNCALCGVHVDRLVNVVFMSQFVILECLRRGFESHLSVTFLWKKVVSGLVLCCVCLSFRVLEYLLCTCMCIERHIYWDSHMMWFTYWMCLFLCEW